MALTCEPIHRLNSANFENFNFSVNCHFRIQNRDYNYHGLILRFLKYLGFHPIYDFCGISQNSPIIQKIIQIIIFVIFPQKRTI